MTGRFPPMTHHPRQRSDSIAASVAAQQAIIDSMAKLPIPKVMSYQLADGETTVKFVRPVHGLVALHGDKVLDIEVLGLKAGRTVHGHRFQGRRCAGCGFRAGHREP